MDELILKEVAGRAADIEVRRLERWRRESPANERAYQEVRALWALAGTASEDVTPPELPQVLAEAEERRRRARSRTRGRAFVRSGWMGYGLAAAVIAFVWLLPERDAPGPDPSALTLVGSSSLAGKTVTMSLSDGSVVRLAPGANVNFPSSLHRREVILEGTAFFAVAPGPEPFVVRAGEVEVTVHGTRFEMRAEGDETRLVVVEGVVHVESRGGGADVASGQVAFLSGASAPRVLDRADVWSLLEWGDGLLLFQNTPLGKVAAELGRAFGRPVQVDSTLADRRVTAWFEDEPVEEVVSAVCLVVGARCEVGDSSITMHARRPEG